MPMPTSKMPMPPQYTKPWKRDVPTQKRRKSKRGGNKRKTNRTRKSKR